jgi:hypothetical protein
LINRLNDHFLAGGRGGQAEQDPDVPEVLDVRGQRVQGEARQAAPGSDIERAAPPAPQGRHDAGKSGQCRQAQGGRDVERRQVRVEKAAAIPPRVCPRPTTPERPVRHRPQRRREGLPARGRFAGVQGDGQRPGRVEHHILYRKEYD